MKKKNVSGLLLICFVCLVCNVLTYSQTAQVSNGNNIDKGDFKVGLSANHRQKNPKGVLSPMSKEIMQPIADELNKVIALPYDIYLAFTKCGEVNAFYWGYTRQITICDEFVENIYKTLKPVYKEGDELDGAVINVIQLVFFHELGHCLIDVWDLPATGREEDAVDQLAVVLSLDGTDEGDDVVLTAAILHNINSTESDMPFWDEHSFDKQRFYNLLCYTYGSNPEKNKDLIGVDLLPKERAVRCPEEYKRADHAWEILLTPYLKS